jgi:hypothetical protein
MTLSTGFVTNSQRVVKNCFLGCHADFFGLHFQSVLTIIVFNTSIMKIAVFFILSFACLINAEGWYWRYCAHVPKDCPNDKAQLECCGTAWEFNDASPACQDVTGISYNNFHFRSVLKDLHSSKCPDGTGCLFFFSEPGCQGAQQRDLLKDQDHDVADINLQGTSFNCKIYSNKKHCGRLAAAEKKTLADEL